jgi:hypothetical protein|tara:strand:+ start:316 stop:459 length:144 start_codon:yes stop_codon:yes gene_type:complete
MTTYKFQKVDFSSVKGWIAICYVCGYFARWAFGVTKTDAIAKLKGQA